MGGHKNTTQHLEGITGKVSKNLMGTKIEFPCIIAFCGDIPARVATRLMTIRSNTIGDEEKIRLYVGWRKNTARSKIYIGSFPKEAILRYIETFLEEDIVFMLFRRDEETQALQNVIHTNIIAELSLESSLAVALPVKNVVTKEQKITRIEI